VDQAVRREVVALVEERRAAEQRAVQVQDQRHVRALVLAARVIDCELTPRDGRVDAADAEASCDVGFGSARDVGYLDDRRVRIAILRTRRCTATARAAGAHHAAVAARAAGAHHAAVAAGAHHAAHAAGAHHPAGATGHAARAQHARSA
jgi:hypothetical protein